MLHHLYPVCTEGRRILSFKVICLCLQARSPQEIIPRPLVDSLVRLLHGGAPLVRPAPLHGASC